MPDGADVAAGLVAFARALRAEGMTVGAGHVVRCCQAVAALDPSDPDDVYWAGRTCLVSRPEDIVTFDRVFRRVFGAGGRSMVLAVRGDTRRFSILVPPERRLDGERTAAVRQGARAGSLSSDLEILRRKRFADCTPAELDELRRLMARLRLVTPTRRSRRRAPAIRRGAVDLRRTIRRSLRSHGEPVVLARRARRLRHRRLVLVLDVSGSMAEYSRALLQFAHTAARARGVPTEVFCFGTRLTRVTHELARRNADQALAKASEAVLDWEGGTRIGESIDTFLRVWGRRGVARGSVVVICSDGLDRGDPAVLATQMERLARLAHRVVWVNPLKGDARYEPLAGGMRAALPYVDAFLSGHDLSSLEVLARLLPELA